MRTALRCGDSVAIALGVALFPAGNKVLAAQDTLLITNAMVVDVRQGVAYAYSRVLLAKGHILAVDDSGIGGFEGPVLDLAGRYLLPGLIDAHVHLSDSTASVALARGVTTLRSMGSVFYRDVALRDSARNSGGRLPEVMAAGYHILNRISRDLPSDDPELADLLDTGVKTPAAAARVTSAQLARQVDWIKTGGDRIIVRPPEPGIWSRRWDRFLVWLGMRQPAERRDLAAFADRPELEPLVTRAQLDTIVALAHAAGRRVASHSYGDSTAVWAALAGAATIEHGHWLAQSSLEVMAAEGAALVPTVALAEDRGHQHLNRLRAVIRAAHQLGIPIAAGSDGDYSGELDVVWEVQALERAGLDRRVALRAATITAAEVLGISDRTGAAEPGLEADLLVVNGNPLDDLAELERPWLVINDGRVLVPSELHAEHAAQADP